MTATIILSGWAVLALIAMFCAFLLIRRQRLTWSGVAGISSQAASSGSPSICTSLPCWSCSGELGEAGA